MSDKPSTRHPINRKSTSKKWRRKTHTYLFIQINCYHSMSISFISIFANISWLTFPMYIWFRFRSQINGFHQTSNKQNFCNINSPKVVDGKVLEPKNHVLCPLRKSLVKKRTVRKAIRIINEVWVPSHLFILYFP